MANTVLKYAKRPLPEQGGNNQGADLLNSVSDCSQKTFTRAGRKQSETEFNKSAITDHATRTNHVIDWTNVSFVDRESKDVTRRIKEAIWIKSVSHTCVLACVLATF